MPRGRPTKRAALSRQQIYSYPRGMIETSASNANTVGNSFPYTTLTIIEDILKCTQCLETTRKTPVYQCEGGHILCANCYPRIQLCPICRKELNLRIRSLVAEMLIARVIQIPKVENIETRISFENVTQKILWVEDKDKQHCLVELLDAAGLRQRNRSKAGSTLVFVEPGESQIQLDDFLYQQGFLVTSWVDQQKTQQQNQESLGMYTTKIEISTVFCSISRVIEIN